MTFILPQPPETANIRAIAAYVNMNSGGGGGTSAWADITGKPTTLSGFGITDAYTKAYIDANFLGLTGGSLTGVLDEIGSTADTTVHQTLVTGDAFARLRIQADGLHAWGSGAATADTFLYRDAANRLRTDGAFYAGGNIHIPQGFTLVSRNAANTADINLIFLNSSNSINIGDGAMVANSSVASFPGNVTCDSAVIASTATLRGLNIGTVQAGTATPTGTPADGDLYFQHS